MDKDEAKWLLDALRKVQFFSSFSLENIDSVLRHFQKYSFEKGKTIIAEGKPGEGFYVVYKGKVKVLKKGALWFKRKIAELGPENFFGEMALISDSPTTATVVTVEPAVIMMLLKTDFQKVVAANQGLRDEIKFIAEKRKYEAKA